MSNSEPELQDQPQSNPVAEEEQHVHIPDLPLIWRLTLLLLGWLVIVLGIAGLVLPGLQGILLIIIGAAILSVASDTVHRILEGLLEHRPNIRRRFNSFRDKLHSWLHRPRS